MERSTGDVTSHEQRTESHIDNGGRRSALITKLTGKLGRLDGLRHGPRIRRPLFLTFDHWN